MVSSSITMNDSTPFRFLDLPGEIRQMVYESLFEGALLEIDRPTYLEEGDCRRVDNVAMSTLPGILLASKQLRAESLGYYSKNLTAIFKGGTLGQEPSGRSYLSQYLRFTEHVILATECGCWIDDAICPSVKSITVFASYGAKVSIEENEEKSADDLRMEYFDSVLDKIDELKDAQGPQQCFTMMQERIGQTEFEEHCDGTDIKFDVVLVMDAFVTIGDNLGHHDAVSCFALLRCLHILTDPGLVRQHGDW